MSGREPSTDVTLSGEKLIERKLQYAKTKAKLVEFSIPHEEYPKFKFDSDDLCFNALHALSSYVDVLLRNEVPDEDTQRKLKKAASFYDAASIEDNHSQFSDGFWLLAMASYFLLENFGSAAVASEHVRDSHYYGVMGARFYFLVRYLLKGMSPNEELQLPKLISYIEGNEVSSDSVLKEAAALLNFDTPESYLFGKVCYVAIRIAMNFAASRWLPEFSDLRKEQWSSYLRSEGACHLLWQAQKRIGQAGAFKGKSLFIQLPTGSGKTRSIQLLIRSRVLAGECKQVVVMAPLRALCSEIARDLGKSLSDIVEVRQAADTFELDSWLGMQSTKPRVFVFTPEKFSYVERHGSGLIAATNLFILDEAHLIDDLSRGASYELTIAEIKQKSSNSQLVMLSAVVQNPEEIASWAMGDSKSCIANSDIPKTEKSLGIIAKKYHLNFWDLEVLGKSEYFVPLNPKVQILNPISRESKNRHFPAVKNEDDGAVPSRELALYMAEQIISTGPVAMYFPQARFIGTFFSRLCELIRHDCKLPRLVASCNRNESQKISKLVDMHYGRTQNNNIFHDGILAGILPHYGNLQGCLRQVVEDELESGNFKCVACTSTLAQGVNLPIKYLIITGVQNGISAVKTRDFQNLLGRVARSGKYSEGSVLISDASILDSYGAHSYSRLLDDRQSEVCVSAIAKLFDELPVEREGVTLVVIPGNNVVNMMLEGLARRDVSSLLIESLVEYGLSISEARCCIASRLISFAAIETYVAGMLEQKSDDVNAVSLSVSTFAYAGADDSVRKLLLKLFQTICETLENESRSFPISIYSKTQMGMAKTNLLKQWLQSTDGDIFLAAEDDQQRLPLICKAYRQCVGNGDEWLDDAALADLASMWLLGRTVNDMCNELKSHHTFKPRKGPNVHRVESALSYDISYELSNFISCIADLLEPVLGDRVPTNLQESLLLLHEKIKFGISTPLGCVISQEIFADRMVVSDLVKILGFAEEGSSNVLRMLMIRHREEVESYLSNLPAYFTKRYKVWLQNV